MDLSQLAITTELYRGKAKTVYRTNSPDLLVLDFRDDTSAFDGEKMEKLAGKGQINNLTNAFVMGQLEQAGLPTHFVAQHSAHESVVKALTMLPLECVVRNRSAGSLCRRLGIAEGLVFEQPLFEFFLKNDALHDPMVNEAHIAAFGWASEEAVAQMKQLSLAANQVLLRMFEAVGIVLVDYKLEFGFHHGQLLIGDEFTADGARLWDATTLEKLDKDRFRKNLGSVVESYREVARRLGLAAATPA